MRGDPEDLVRLFSVPGGEHWRYRLAATPNASLVALEALPDGDLLSLERGHGLMFLPMIITVRRVHLDWQAPASMATVTTLATLDTSEGFSVDNFEGLCRYRDLEFFMVSDDNFNDLQKTLLVHFALAETGGAAGDGNARDYEPGQKTPD
ncbi:MAG: esterase-like activity of phytase family protein, partial [Gammaproteobacteria bacterium]|nr:esterase-like activity of phytase family protein [Gammaproteobacteria bacterium]